jgi:hypothetical protein
MYDFSSGNAVGRHTEKLQISFRDVCSFSKYRLSFGHGRRPLLWRLMCWNGILYLEIEEIPHDIRYVLCT